MKIKNKKEKLPLRLAFLVTITVCLILVASMLLAGIIMLILTKFFEDSGVPFFIVVYVFTICLMFAWIATRIVSDKIFIPMVKLNEAMKKVAEGDFTVRMNETGMFREVREMIRNFNIMAGELGANKIIHTDFTRNVSHEIMIPLVGDRGVCDAAAKSRDIRRNAFGILRKDNPQHKAAFKLIIKRSYAFQA